MTRQIGRCGICGHSWRVTTQPNIVLIMADQMAAPFMAPWGGPAITPAIERLAADGVVFEWTYSNSPLCAPARFAMMAGQQNHKIGAYEVEECAPFMRRYVRAQASSRLPQKTFAHERKVVQLCGGS